MELSSQVISNISAALLAAQADLQKVSLHADMKNQYLGNKYISLSSLLKATLPVLSKNNILLLQRVIPSENPNVVSVETRLIHVNSGEFLSTCMDIPLESRNTKVSPAQIYGSCVSYGKRYGLASLMAASIDTEDDDGNASMPFERHQVNRPAPSQEVPPVETSEGFPELPGVKYNHSFSEDGHPIDLAIGPGVFKAKDSLKKCGFNWYSDKKAWIRIQAN